MTKLSTKTLLEYCREKTALLPLKRSTMLSYFSTSWSKESLSLYYRKNMTKLSTKIYLLPRIAADDRFFFLKREDNTDKTWKSCQQKFTVFLVNHFPSSKGRTLQIKNDKIVNKNSTPSTYIAADKHFSSSKGRTLQIKTWQSCQQKIVIFHAYCRGQPLIFLKREDNSNF